MQSEKVVTLNKVQSKRSFLIPSIGDFLFLAVFLLISLHSGKNLLNDGDTGYHIRAGEDIVRTLAIPRYDMFSYLSPPLPWTAHEWLSEVIMALVHKGFGLTGVVIFFGFFISLTFYLLFKMIHSDDKNLLVSVFVVILAAAASRMHWLARPHIFSMVLLLVWYHILDLYQYKEKNLLYLLPIIMIVWVNLHGGFMGGFLVLGAYLLGNMVDSLRQKEEKGKSREKIRAFAVTALACVAATLVNPYGYHILLFPFQLTSSKVIMDTISEFLSPNFHESYVKAFEGYLLLLLATLGMSRFKLNLIEVILITLFLYMSLYSARYIPLFAIITAPILSRQLNLCLESSESKISKFIKTRSSNISAIDSASAGFTWPVATIILVIVLLRMDTILFKFNPETKPMAAIEFIKKEKISGNMFNNDEFGDCLIYSAYPMYRVWIDGRIDMYGASQLKEYNKVTSVRQGWETVLDKYRVSWIIFNANSVLSRHLLIHKDWKLIYADKVTNIFVKNVPEYRYLIEKYPSVRPVVEDDKKDDA